MRFVFDPVKSASNKADHGIDFIEAQALWLDEDRIEAPARTHRGEPRVAITGRIQQTLWTAIVTYRHENTLRLISVRHPHPNESRAYRRAAGDLD